MVLANTTLPPSLDHREEELLCIRRCQHKYPYLTNALKVLSLSIDVGCQEKVRDHQIVTIATTLCPKALGFLEEEEAEQYDMSTSKHALTVSRLEGGLSNALFVVANENNVFAQVLIRIHPADEKSLIGNRTTENKLVAWLGELGDAPKIYGCFANGRVEQFYARHEPLSCHDMSQHEAAIARLMSTMHQRQPMPGLFSPTTDGHIWDRLERWFTLSQSVDDALLHVLETEVRWLREQLARSPPRNTNSSSSAWIERRVVDFCSEIVLCHMDCQSLNLLREPHTPAKELRWIDFEYAGLNPRAADIANTFCEHCDMNNLKADYPNEYPSHEAQDKFLRAYLDHYLSQSPLAGLDEGEQDSFLTAMGLEVGRYTLLSHLSWSIWSLAQHRLSNIDYDYIEYAKHRFEGYKYCKQRFF